MQIPEGRYLSINIGGVQQVGDVEIHAVPAMHSVEPGRALGYVLRFADGRTLYHSGDTWAFGDMELIERFYHPTILLLTAGGGRAGEDPATAAFGRRCSMPSRPIRECGWRRRAWSCPSDPPPFSQKATLRIRPSAPTNQPAFGLANPTAQ